MLLTIDLGTAVLLAMGIITLYLALSLGWMLSRLQLSDEKRYRGMLEYRLRTYRSPGLPPDLQMEIDAVPYLGQRGWQAGTERVYSRFVERAEKRSRAPKRQPLRPSLIPLPQR
jgi:hypothetical protein